MLKRWKKAFAFNKQKYESFLDDHENRLWVIFNAIINFLVLFFIFLLALESVGGFSANMMRAFFIFDAFISVVFAYEYFYRLIKTKHKWRFVLSPIRIIDLLSFLPFFLWFVSLSDFWKVLRLLRVLKVLRLVKKIPLTGAFVKSIKDYIDEYKAILILFTVVLLIGSFLVYFAEKDVPGTKFTSIPITLWWGLVTMTTVWFGDIYPMTALGRIFWSMLVFLWPLLLAVSSAVTIMVFMETNENQRAFLASKRIKICRRCNAKNVKNANYCIVCGQKLPMHDDSISDTSF